MRERKSEGKLKIDLANSISYVPDFGRIIS